MTNLCYICSLLVTFHRLCPAWSSDRPLNREDNVLESNNISFVFDPPYLSQLEDESQEIVSVTVYFSSHSQNQNLTISNEEINSENKSVENYVHIDVCQVLNKRTQHSSNGIAIAMLHFRAENKEILQVDPLFVTLATSEVTEENAGFTGMPQINTFTMSYPINHLNHSAYRNLNTVTSVRRHFTVTGKFLGHSSVEVSLLLQHNNNATCDHQKALPVSEIITLAENYTIIRDEFHVSIIRQHRVIDKIFLGAVILFIIFGTITMGCKIDLQIVKEVMLKPIGPIIGFCCQFLIMPLTAFGLTLLLGFEGGVALGYFASGCAPGGGMSNIYTFMFRGDVSLSVTMTFISTLASLGMIPVWLYTLGYVIMNQSDSGIVIKIPFLNILSSLAAIAFPLGVGILIKKYRPNTAALLLKIIRPIVIFFIIFMFTFGVYTNLYIFKLFTVNLVIGGMCLPYIGFTAGAVVAILSRMPRERIVAISLETGIQNTGIAILLMKLTLPQPDADLSIVGPVIISMFTPAPLLIGLIIVESKRFHRRRQKAKDFQKVNMIDNVTANSNQNCANEPVANTNV